MLISDQSDLVSILVHRLRGEQRLLNLWQFVSLSSPPPSRFVTHQTVLEYTDVRLGLLVLALGLVRLGRDRLLMPLRSLLDPEQSGLLAARSGTTAVGFPLRGLRL